MVKMTLHNKLCVLGSSHKQWMTVLCCCCTSCLQ